MKIFKTEEPKWKYYYRTKNSFFLIFTIESILGKSIKTKSMNKDGNYLLDQRQS